MKGPTLNPGICVAYDRERYQEHLSVLEEMRREVEQRLAGITLYTLFVSDDRGLIAKISDPNDHEDRSADYAICADLSKGTVTVKTTGTLHREEIVLKRLGIVHECVFQGDNPTSVTLGLEDALKYLPDVLNHRQIRSADGAIAIRAWRY